MRRYAIVADPQSDSRFRCAPDSSKFVKFVSSRFPAVFISGLSFLLSFPSVQSLPSLRKIAITAMIGSVQPSDQARGCANGCVGTVFVKRWVNRSEMFYEYKYFPHFPP